MAGKVLLINRDSALMVNRLVALLRESDVETAIIEPEIEQIETEMNNTDVFVLFTGEFVYDALNTLAYLSNACFDRAKPLCVVGYDKELAKVNGVISNNVTTREFSRPFDIKNLSTEILTLLLSKNDVQKQILLVDDDLTFLRMVKNWLGTRYNVTVAHSGTQAIGYLAEHKADLILLDYDMPVMSGPQVLEALRSEPKSADIPVIFLTGKNDRDSVMTVIKLKPEGYILKSSGSDDILKSVQNFFEKRK